MDICSIFFSTMYFVAIGISAVIGTVDVPAVFYHMQTGIVGFASTYVTKAKWIVVAMWLAFMFISYMGFIGSRYGPAFILMMSALLLGLNPFAQFGISYLAYQTGLTKNGRSAKSRGYIKKYRAAGFATRKKEPGHRVSGRA